MKKLILIAFMLLGSIPLGAYEPICWQTGIYGGANLEEASPDFGAYISFDRYHIRCELDIGWGNIHHDKHNFLYVNPMVGFYIGNDFKCFGLVGLTNWGGIDKQTGDFRATYFVPKVKLGGEIPLTPYLCLSVYWNYIIPSQTEKVTAYQNNATMVSLGFKF